MSLQYLNPSEDLQADPEAQENQVHQAEQERVVQMEAVDQMVGSPRVKLVPRAVHLSTLHVHLALRLVVLEGQDLEMTLEELAPAVELEDPDMVAELEHQAPADGLEDLVSLEDPGNLAKLDGLETPVFLADQENLANLENLEAPAFQEGLEDQTFLRHLESLGRLEGLEV